MCVALKRSNRKAFTTTKKKIGSAVIDNYNEKSISPSIKMKKAKEKSTPFNNSGLNNLHRIRSGDDSANTSFTTDCNKSAMDGKNLIDEFNHKYATTDKIDNSGQNNGNESEESDTENSKINDTSIINENVAVIHVIDESKKRKQDFKCSISKLLKHMKYFEKSINGCEDKIGLDISVHCDLDTFEWLIKYIHLDKQIIHKSLNIEAETKQTDGEDPGGNLPKSNGMTVLPMFDAISMFETNISNISNDLNLNLSNIITLLVAAEYLKMDNLKEECIEFIGLHFEEICKLKINMNFLKPQTLERLSQLVDIEVLDVMRERKDKFIKLLLKDSGKKIQRCVYCDAIFTSSTELICSQNPEYFIDTHGELRCFHIADIEFDVNKFVRFVKEKYRVSWRELYWKIWSYNYTLKCIKCYEYFSLPKYCFCNASKVVKSCGITQSGISSIIDKQEQPREKFHQIENKNSNEIFESLMKRKHIICESNIIDQVSDSIKDSSNVDENSKPFHKRLNHFDGMNNEEIKFFSPQSQGELLSCNYRLSLNKALLDYLKDLRHKEGRPQSERTEFEIESDPENIDVEGLPHSDFFDINIKEENIYKELDFIKKRLEERKKIQIKQAMKLNKQLTKEQEVRK